MNKEKLNTIMNCECLQSIIENDSQKHSREEERLGTKVIESSNDNGEIIFECFTSYRRKIINNNNQIVVDRNQKDYCGIPFLYCPICGTKTKNNVYKESFYAQFQVCVN